MSEQKAAGGQQYNVKGYEGYLNHDVSKRSHSHPVPNWHLAYKIRRLACLN